jgi:hypothetical protein
LKTFAIPYFAPNVLHYENFKTLSLKVSEFEKINDISNEDFRGVLSHAQTIYFLIDFYNQNKIKKQNKVEKVVPSDNRLITS